MKQVRDQSTHALAAIMILLPLALLPNIFTFTLVGACLGLIREVTEKGLVTSKGSLLDIFFWAVGGMVAGVVAT